MSQRRLPAGLPLSTPRPIRLTVAGKVAIAAAVALPAAALALGVWLYIVAARDALRFKLLEREGVATQAEVVELGRRRGEEGKREVRYRYVAGGQAYIGRANLKRRKWQGIETGSRLAVRYLPSKASISWVGDQPPKGVPLWTVPLVPLFLVLAAVPIVYSLQRQRWLLSQGRPTLARVTHSHPVKHGTHLYRIHFEFRILSGAVRTGTYDEAKVPPAPGSTLTILYDADDSRRYARYPFSLVRTMASQP